MVGIDLLDDLFDLPDPGNGMNEDLAAWAAEHDVAAEQEAAARPPVGPCTVCRQPGDRRCLRCGGTVCVRHLHVMVGLCARCQEHGDGPDDEAAKEPRGIFDDERPATRPELDLDWIE